MFACEPQLTQVCEIRVHEDGGVTFLDNNFQVVMPELTVAVCTHNRFEDLPHVLDALSRQTMGPDAFEILIVDNSTDDSARDGFRAAYRVAGNVRWLESSPPGLSRARNVALESARAPVVAFLDDDATPCPEWAEELVLTFRAHPEAATVAGPIEADWRGMERPAWMPAKYEACLAVLDLGPEDRPLGAGEYGYGANLSLRRESAIATGCFDEALGRKGSASLLSNEEIVIQDSLREAGYGARWAAKARVRHRIQSARLTRDWFRARLAWQAVSDALLEGGWPWADWSRQEVRRAAEALGIEATTGALLAPRDGDAFADQLDLLTHLIRLLLGAGKGSEDGLETLFPPPATEPKPAEAEPVSDAYRPAAALPSSTAFVFADYRNSHHYLFDLYGDLPGSAFVELPGLAWSGDPDEGLAYLEASMPPNARAVILLTLDPFSLDARRAAALTKAIARWRIPTIGIQHRLPETADQRQTFAGLARGLESVVALSDDMQTRLKGYCNLTNVASLPLHPTNLYRLGPERSQRARTAIGAAPGHTVLGLVGEAREGKGISLLLSAIDHLTAPVRDALFVLAAGRAAVVDPDAVLDHFSKRRVAARIDLRKNNDPTHYAVLTSHEYGDAIAASDFGLLLYQGQQRGVSSGALSDFVWQRKRVLVTRDSFVGAEVARYRLGLTLDTETPEALAGLITEAVAMHQAGTGLTPEFEVYRDMISPTATLARLKTLLDTVHRREPRR
jgi:glucosyl-dolichyl phosphate glucuronosyltransferase